MTPAAFIPAPDRLPATCKPHTKQQDGFEVGEDKRFGIEYTSKCGSSVCMKVL